MTGSAAVGRVVFGHGFRVTAVAIGDLGTVMRRTGRALALCKATATVGRGAGREKVGQTAQLLTQPRTPPHRGCPLVGQSGEISAELMGSLGRRHRREAFSRGGLVTSAAAARRRNIAQRHGF